MVLDPHLLWSDLYLLRHNWAIATATIPLLFSYLPHDKDINREWCLEIVPAQKESGPKLLV